MFLITTADQRFWRTDRPVLFLGEWCRLFSEQNVWEKLDHEVLPYHWDDRKRLYQDYQYIDQVYENVLVQVSAWLNKLHQEDHGVRYWRMLIGPWLNGFIGILYDRYLSIHEAAAFGKVTGTIIAQYPFGKWTPRDTGTFIQWFIGDAYNHYLYSRIIELTGKIPSETITIQDAAIPLRPAIRPLPMLARTVARLYNKLLQASENRAVLVASYLTITDQVLLQLALGQCPGLEYPEIDVPASKADRQKRTGLSLANKDDAFVQLLHQLLPEQVPQCYIESYGQLKTTARQVFPTRPRIIFTSNAHVQNEHFKVWTASAVEQGALFIGMQHGGFEGMGLWYSLEDHQSKIWDRYYTWGWQRDRDKAIKPLPSSKLQTARKLRSDRNGRILMVNNAFIRYSYFMQSMPVGASGHEAYLKDIFAFIRCLDDAARKILTARLYPYDYCYSERERLEREFPGLDCYRGGKSMHAQMKKSRLFIGTTNTTANLEAFVADMPTLLFWNPGHWELREEARPYFDELRKAGILHDTPASAATKVNEIWRDPLAWWRQPGIQAAKNAFCRQFARTSENWLNEWKTEILDLESLCIK